MHSSFIEICSMEQFIIYSQISVFQIQTIGFEQYMNFFNFLNVRVIVCMMDEKKHDIKHLSVLPKSCYNLRSDSCTTTELSDAGN